MVDFADPPSHRVFLSDNGCVDGWVAPGHSHMWWVHARCQDDDRVQSDASTEQFLTMAAKT